jgi:hypothetical protein
LQVAGESIELVIPEGAVAFEPQRRILERRRDNLATPFAADQLPLDQAGALEHPKVLRDTRQRHLERRGDRHRRRRPAGQLHQNLPPRGVREGAEDRIEPGRVFVHHSDT